MNAITTPMDVLDDTRGLDDDLQQTAREYLQSWTRWQQGLQPSTAAAAAYYAAGLTHINDHPNGPTQADVARLFDASEVSIREWYGDILDARGVDP